MSSIGQKSLQFFEFNGVKHQFFSLKKFESISNINISKLPFSLKILLENQLRCGEASDEVIIKIATSNKNPSNKEIFFKPTRVLMQDFTGVPAVVDLATMRHELAKRGRDPKEINPLIPVDLIIDHSIQVDVAGKKNSLQENLKFENQRNKERYEFLKWAQESFKNFRVVPPGTGICHQINLENLAKVVWTKDIENGEKLAYPDTVVGTDSHTTMINALSVLGWGVGGIEAESAMLGNSISMTIPKVAGVKLINKISPSISSMDVVLTIVNVLREHGVVGKFVEFYGDGVDSLSLADRSTISNMAPEYGATCGFFATDQETLDYLHLSGRSEETINLVEKYSKIQGLFKEKNTPDPEFNEYIEVDLAKIEATLAGPKRPQDKVLLSEVKKSFSDLLDEKTHAKVPIHSLNCSLGDGDIVLASITSCTNTSNPSSLLAAALLAKKACQRGLKTKRFVKTSFAPGSQVASEYISNAGLQKYLDQLGFNIVGYGCATCIGNSGPLNQEIENIIQNKQLTVAAVLSGNRNFEGRIHPLTKANYLASPSLVVAYSLVGNINIDISSDSLGLDHDGKDVYLKDIWPTEEEIQDTVKANVSREIFVRKYQNLFKGDLSWQSIPVKKSDIYDWDLDSSYIRMPDFFSENNLLDESGDIRNVKILAKFADSITTDHISPAGSIAEDSPAANYLNSKDIAVENFNSYGSRRGNHEVMIRGTFANIRIKNEMTGGKIGGYTIKDGVITTIYDAAEKYNKEKTNLVIVAGKEYGTGSSRDWAAKGTSLLGINAVIAESFERIHRSNLIGMGVLPLLFKEKDNRNSLNLRGDEEITIFGAKKVNSLRQPLKVSIKYQNGNIIETEMIASLDTQKELDCYIKGGIFKSIL
ncbi:aconitate hydratase AcnA [Flavobacteriaceae bacterium]|nr:aconitate hydratase AcnA [Flavobacteriaceae bacterium]